MHRITASALFEKPEEQITPEERKIAKINLFMTIYGGGVDKMVEQFNITKAKATKMQSNLFKRYPGIKKYQDDMYNFSMAHGYMVADNFIRRKIYIQDFEKLPYLSNRERKRFMSKIFRDSSNYNIQSPAATMTKLAGIYLRQEYKKHGWFKLVLKVHDEAVNESDIQKAEETKLIVEDCMRRAAEVICKSISIPAEAIITKQWSK